MYIPRFISALSITSIMAAAFHWVKVKAVCYATEDEDRIHDTMVQLIGNDDEEVFDIDISEGKVHIPRNEISLLVSVIVFDHIIVILVLVINAVYSLIKEPVIDDALRIGFI